MPSAPALRKQLSPAMARDGMTGGIGLLVVGVDYADCRLR